jgi:hypothetical protein
MDDYQSESDNTKFSDAEFTWEQFAPIIASLAIVIFISIVIFFADWLLRKR